MKKFVYKVLLNLFSIILVLLVIMMLIFGFLTPEKTKYRTYTNVIKYWTSDSYVCDNFDCPVQKEKGVKQ